MKTFVKCIVVVLLSVSVVACHAPTKATVSKEKQAQMDKDKKDFEHNVK